jgi:hypothetical protein
MHLAGRPRYAATMARMPWYHPQLRVSGEPPDRARHRLLQSWYREVRLEADYDESRTRPVGNLLAPHEVARRPGLNFYDEDVYGWALEQEQAARARHGTLDSERLHRNMLSSMPMCFNIFGSVRGAAGIAELVAEAFGVPATPPLAVRVEWAPDSASALGDKTAFDAFLEFSDPAGARCFLGIETKYTESFSPQKYPAERYRAATEASGWFREGAPEALAGAATNQLWRNVLLASVVERTGDYDRGWSATVHLESDRHLHAARDLLEANLAAGDDHVRWCSLERLASIAANHDSTRDWAAWFTERYLDTEPVARHI